MSDAHVQELSASIGQKGVREPITVTPLHCAPWAPADRTSGAYFLIVSGHFRTKAANNAGLRAVPVRVVIYANAADHREDAALLNAIRQDLNELEQGLIFVELRELGRTIADISARFGVSAPTLYNRINLTKLDPSIQKLLYPDDATTRRFPIIIAGALGGLTPPSQDELEALFLRLGSLVSSKTIRSIILNDLDETGRLFAAQRLLCAIVLEKKLTASSALQLIAEQTVEFEGTRGTGVSRDQRNEPLRRKRVLKNLCATTRRSVVVDWTPESIRSTFADATLADLNEHVRDIKAAGDVFSGLDKILETLRNEKLAKSKSVVPFTTPKKN